MTEAEIRVMLPQLYKFPEGLRQKVAELGSNPQSPWTARRSNQSILKEIIPEYSLEGLDTEAETPILWPPGVKSQLIGKDLRLGEIEGKRRSGQQRMRWLDSMADSVGMNLSKFREIVEDRGAWHAVAYGVAKNQTQLSNAVL